MIELINIKKIFKSKYGREYQTLKNINLELNKGEFIGVVGRSGSGKTTLLNILAGLDKFESGDMYINNMNFKGLTDKEIDMYRKSNIGIVYQKFNLLNHLTALENVELALKIKGEVKTRRKAKEMLIKVGLKKQINKKPGYMSGGQKQRVALARALVTNPDILLLDEPTGQLDSDTSIEIMELVKSLSKNKLVIMVTHMEELIKKYASRIIKLNDGIIIDDTRVINSNLEKEEEQKKIYNNKINILSISYTNIKRRKKSALLLLFILTITFSLILTSLILGSKSVQSDIYKVFASNTPLNLIKLKKENEETFSTLELNNLSEINNIESVIPIYFKSAIINDEEPVNQIDFLKEKYKESTEVEQNSKIYKELNTIKNVEILPKDKNKFYLKNALENGVYPRADNEVIIDIDTAISLIDSDGRLGLWTKYLLNFIDNNYIWDLVKQKQLYIYDIDNELNLSNVLELDIVGMVDNSSWDYSNVDFYINSKIVPELLTMYNITNDIKEVNVYINNFDKQSREKTQSNINKVDKYINVLDDTEIKATYNKFKALIDLVNFVVYLSIVITILSLYALINLSCYTRIKEVGILKSLGADSNSIIKIFLYEIMIILFISSLICYPIAFTCVNLFLKLNNLLYSTGGKNINLTLIYIDIFLYILVIIIGIILVLISAYIPINKNSKLNIVDSLREIDY